MKDEGDKFGRFSIKEIRRAERWRRIKETAWAVLGIVVIVLVMWLMARRAR